MGTMDPMGTIHREIIVDADPDAVWDALRDFGAVHERLVPGFVTAARLDGRDRIVTFFNGAVARELLVTLDDEARRLVWSVAESPMGMVHHNAATQVFPAGGGRTRFVWVTDVLPDEAVPRIAELMDRALPAIARTLGSAS